jgi:hypothetical protein
MDDPLETEIEERFQLAGITLPAERRASAINAAKGMLAVRHWLRGPRTAAAEPSNTFSLVRREA